MPDADQGPEQTEPAAQGDSQLRRLGWPLWLRILLAAVVIAFVWSPFLAMLARLSQLSPKLQPTGDTTDLIPPPAAPAPRPADSGAPPVPAPSP